MQKTQTFRLTAMAAALLASLSASAADVVISQVYGGGGNNGATIKSDFIEIFNRSSSPVSLNGWAVHYASATGTFNQTTKLTNITLQPGQYYLVKEQNGSGGSVDLPTPDATGNIAMSGTAAKVALTNTETAPSGTNPSGGNLVDLIGWGTANGFEGAVAPQTGTNAVAAIRNGGGCADTDNNAADFTIATANPRNSSSPLNVCGAPVVKNIVPVCPANVNVARGVAQNAALTASDADGIVNAASITSSAVAGITLNGFSAASAEGQNASATLSIANTVLAGSYPVVIQWGNNQSQTASCTVNVTVADPNAVTHSIMQIQGSGATSPIAGQKPTTEGVVTAKVSTGFFIQDPAGDGNPDTSDAVFVYMNTTPFSVNVGDKVRVTGTVSEFTPSGATRSYTELTNPTVATVGSGSVTPTNITLGQDLSKVEGMLVRFAQTLVINHSEYLATRGELELGSYRHEQPTNRYPARSNEAKALSDAQLADTIVLDDGIFVTPTVIPYIGQDGTVRVGDSVRGLTGVVDFGAVGGGGAGFKLQPTEAPQFSRDNPRIAAPEVAAGNVRVASANVLNFFTTFTNGQNIFGQSGQSCTVGCRGADNKVEFERQRDKIVAELKAMDADVVGLMEIQNNGDIAVGYLVDQLNAVTAPGTYAYVPKPPATGTDAIRVAMVYKPGKVNLVGNSLSDADSINNRPPMAQTFRAANGEKFSVIVNHLKSKGSCPTGSGANADKDNGDYQGCWNATRMQQAQRLATYFVPTVQAAAGDPDVLIIGDMNSYGMEDPITVLTNAGFVNQLERFVRPTGAVPHSYVFDGLSGYLDHALASATLSPQVAGVTEWNVNADEPVVTDYNTESKPQDLYAAGPYRASDHDPVVISLALQPAVQDVTASVKTVIGGYVFNRVTNKFTSTLQLTNTTGAALNGPLQVEFQSLTSGVSLANATGMHNGNAVITLPNGLAAGASVTLPLQFNNPSKGGIGYTPKVFSGNF